MSSVQERISLLAEKDVIARAVTAKANYFHTREQNLSTASHVHVSPAKIIISEGAVK